jgi:iron complex outermembrane receptor protein
MIKAALIAFFMLCSICTNAQQTGSIRGTVFNINSLPAELVNISLKGTSFGTTSNNTGYYELNNIPGGKYLLIFSHVGYKTKEIIIEVSAGKTTEIPAVTLEETQKQLEEVIVKGNAERSILLESDYVAKLPLKNIENPQVYNTITSSIMKEQGVTSFDDALKNAPGIEKLWESTGRTGDGSAYYALRGFEAQATMVNGIAGLTNGSLDPANIEKIEVIKGPSGTLFGSSLISYGGLINTVTKKPYSSFGGEAEYISGSFGLNRVTADVNLPVSSFSNSAIRIISSYHSENSFQDAGFKRSIFVAPSFRYSVNDRLSFQVNTEFIQAEGTNPVMLFLNRSNPLEFRNLDELNYNYKLSLTNNDISIKNPRYNLQAVMEYRLSDNWVSQTSVSRGSAESNGYYSYLWDNYLPNSQFSLYISDQNSKTLTTSIQENITGDVLIAGTRNRILVGFDYFNRELIDNSTGYALLHNVTPQGEINYIDPNTNDTLPTHYLSHQSVEDLLSDYPRSNSNSKNETYSMYISDVVNITPQLIVMASLRLDYFDTEGDITTDEDNYNQTTLSPKFGIIYQPVQDKVALFANYMNGFKNVAPAQVADQDGSNPRIKTYEPEHANQYEAGIKLNLLSDRIVSTLSYYNIRVSNVVISDPENINNSTQGGETESKGFEVDINASPFAGLNLIAGFSYNESKILEGETNNIWFQEGKRPVYAGPQRLFNTWLTYKIPSGLFYGFGIGLGANSASELLVIDSDVTGKFVLPGYTIINSSLFYDNNRVRLSFNLNNIGNKEYYKGYSTINPQKPRNFTASINFRF